VFFLFISFVCSFFLFQLKQNGNEWNGSTHFVLLKEERTTHTLLSRSFRSFPFPFAQFNSRLHFFSLQLNWSERRERGKRGVRRMKREKTQVKSERGVHFIYPLSLIHLFFCSSLTILSGELLSEGWVKGTEVKWKGKWRMTARLSLLFISLHSSLHTLETSDVLTCVVL